MRATTCAWWIAFIILVVLVAFIEHIQRPKHYRLLDRYLASTLPNEIAVLDRRRVDDGYKAMKESTVVIAGLIRNGENHISHIKRQTEHLGSHFLDYRILVVENDSTDTTRQQLLAWHGTNPKVNILGCGVNSKDCILKLPPTIGHGPDYNRIIKMAYLRNIYLGYVREHYDSFDYLVVLDLDIIGTCYIDGIASSFASLEHHPEIDAISSNGRRLDVNTLAIGEYYDPFAHRSLGSKIDFDSLDEKLKWDQDHCKFTPRIDGNLIRIASGFGGLTIYRLSSLLGCGARYAPPPRGKLGCEHVPLNMSLERFYVNPGMLFMVVEN